MEIQKCSVTPDDLKHIYSCVRQLNDDLSPKDEEMKSMDHFKPYEYSETPASKRFVNCYAAGRDFLDLTTTHCSGDREIGVDYVLDSIFYRSEKLDLMPILNAYRLDREMVDPVRHYLDSLVGIKEFCVSDLFINALYPPVYVKLSLAVVFTKLPLENLPEPVLTLSEACSSSSNWTEDEESDTLEPDKEFLKEHFPGLSTNDAKEMFNSIRAKLQAEIEANDAFLDEQLKEAVEQSNNITQIFEDCDLRMTDLAGKLGEYATVQARITEDHKPIPERPDIVDDVNVGKLMVIPPSLSSVNELQQPAASLDDADDIQIISSDNIATQTKSAKLEESLNAAASRIENNVVRPVSEGGVIDLTESGGSDSLIFSRPSSSGQDVIPVGSKTAQSNPSFNLSRDPPDTIPILKAGDQCLVWRHLSRYGLSHQWSTALIHNVENNLDPLVNAKKLYTVTYHGKTERKTVDGKRVAFAQPSNWILPVGTRIAACYVPKDTGSSGKKEIRIIFGGIVAEVPSTRTNWRYLIFFDDGDTQYCWCNTVFRVSEHSKEIWKDMDSDSATQNFIKEYMKLYPEKAMVRLHKNMQVKTERNEQWHSATVLRVDASLVVLRYEDGQEETIYRGSERLWPLFEQKQQQIKADQPAGKATAARRNRTGYQLEFNQLTDASNAGPVASSQPGSQQRRQTARKSTSGRLLPANGAGSERQPSPSAKGQTDNYSADSAGPIENLDTYGIVQDREYIKRASCAPIVYRAHDKCSAVCKTPLESVNILTTFKAENPLFIPLECGWDRQIAKFKNKTKKCIYYRAPCGRRMRNIQEVLNHLDTTGTNLTIDMFSFNHSVEPRKEFFVPKCSPMDKDTLVIKRQMEDIARGRESVHIPVINTIDFSLPQVLDYSKERFADPNKINLAELRAETKGCDCKDDCRDASKCACHRRTIDSSLVGSKRKTATVEKVGYRYHRLMGMVQTGIFECNHNCKCSSKCLNRTIQNPLQRRLQVYKTCKKGWALRTLDDIPKGAFIATYSGQLLPDDDAEGQGTSEGDEFFADLDFIERLAEAREGVNPNNFSFSDDDSGSDDNDDGDEEENDALQDAICSSPAVDPNQSSDSNDTTVPAVVAKASRASSEDSGLGDEAKKGKNKSLVSKLPKTADADDGMEKKTLRELMFGNNSMVVIDAKTKGNVGRYLNHSCSPNVFVQNVLFDTHDYRYPWVAFFANETIFRGEELCWDYNYEIGSASGKRLDCRCGSDICRGRIL